MSGKPVSGAAIGRRAALRLAVTAGASCVLAAAAALTLSACGDPDAEKQAARDSVDAELNRLTTASASDLLGDSLAGIENLGISGDDFLAAFFDGCSWTTGEASLEDGVATVGVSVTCRSLSAVLEALSDAYTSQTLEDGGTPTESLLFATAGKALLDCIHAAQLATRTVDVTLAKQDGSWVIDDAGRAALTSALLGA